MKGTPLEEERAARQRQRNLEKARRAKQRKEAAQARERRQQVIRRELARSHARQCRCGITIHTTLSELLAMGGGCTDTIGGRPGWVCPVLDAIRRGLGH